MRFLGLLLFSFVSVTELVAQTSNQTSLEVNAKEYALHETIDSSTVKNGIVDKLINYKFIHLKSNKKKTHLSLSPLFDAAFGYDSQKKHSISSSGVGIMLDGQLNGKVFLNAKIFQGSGSFPSHIDSVIRKTNIMPFAGYAHPLAGNKYYFWNNSFNLRYTPNTFFSFVFANDRNFLGNGYRSLLLSNNAANYLHLKIEANLWRVKYKAIFANFYDVRLSNGNFNDFKNKYGAIHYLQWQVVKKLQLSFFEAILFQSRKQNGFGYDINYLNPLIFYRPVEFSMGSTDNSILGGNLQWTVKQNVTIYSQIVLDEFLLSAVKARKGWIDNKQGLQIGLKTTHKMGKQYLNVLAEFNYLRPFIYSHRNGNQNYSNYGMSLAHPFGGNFYEVLGSVKYRHASNFQLNITGSYALIGYDMNGISYGQNINNSYINRVQRTPKEADNPENGNYVAQGLATKQGLLHIKTFYCINQATNTCINTGVMIRVIRNSSTSINSIYPFIGVGTQLFKEGGIF